MADTLAHRKMLGVLVPYFNTVVEPELADLRPDGVSNQTARFALDAGVLQHVATAAENLMPCQPAAFIVGLATESFPGGLALLQQGADDVAAKTGVPVCTASHATHAALRALGVQRVAVATPFDADGNGHVREAYEAAGFTVIAIDGLARPDLATIGHSSLEDIRALFEKVNSPEAEALVQIGTGLPVTHLIDELEQRFAKPVVACNAASYWQALRETGIADQIRGFGRLLAEH